MVASSAPLLKKLKPYIIMVVLQFGYAGMGIIAVASLKGGMSHFVLVVYRNIVAAIFIAPFAFFFERKVRPKMTLRSFLKIMLLALLEPVLDQNFYYAGAKLTSASFAQALYNLLPAITFVLAVILRMEKMEMKSLYSRAKIVGTVVTAGGAILMILYRGPMIEFPWTIGRKHHHTIESRLSGPNFIKGTILLILASLSWSLFFILQSHTLRSYPAEMSLTTGICAMGALESAVVALVAERRLDKWAIGFDMRLATAVYSGIICTGVAYYAQGKVIKERGPVFVTAFNPLCMIIVAIMGSFILAEEITLGRAIGAGVIVIGLYLLIWGKSKDEKRVGVQMEKGEENKKNALELPITATTPTHPSRKVEEKEPVATMDLPQNGKA